MALNQTYKKSEGGEFFLIPEDSYIAKLYSIVDLGEQDTGFRKFKEDKVTGKKTDMGPLIQNKVMLSFELEGVAVSDGRPAVISNTYTASLNEKATLADVLLSLLGGGAEAKEYLFTEGRQVGEVLESVAGKAVLLSIIHNKKGDKTYANIKSVSPVPSSLKKSVTPLINEKVVVLDVDSIDPVVLSKLSDFVKTKINNRIKSVDVHNKQIFDDTENPF